MDNIHHIISQSTTLFSALERLNNLSGGIRTLMAVDSDGHVTGTLTDGDVRRALLRGDSLQTKVSEVMHRDYRYLEHGNIDIDEMRRIRSLGISLVPVIDNEKRLINLIDTRYVTTVLPLTAILMAGGRGERLRPLTLDTPKPLLKVGDRPIIDYNIAMLAHAGINDITVSVNYLAEKIEKHFANPVSGVQVKTVREPIALGTIGSASLIKRANPDGATLVMNSDLLTNLDLEEMWLRHKAEAADITIAAVPYNISVPYAVLATSGQSVTALEEKPSMSFWTNAGIYIISNHLLDELPDNRRTDATDLINNALSRNLKVSYFPINGIWIDIGSPADYRHACDLMSLDTPSYSKLC